MPDNIERLRKAGFTIKTRMPKAYEEVLQGLSKEEMNALTQMDALISLAEDLERAGGRLKKHWTYYVLPP